MLHSAKGYEAHPHPTLLSDFILGSQDGLVNVLGILLGLSAAAAQLHIILIAALAALGAETISMGAVAYTSTLSRRRLYLAEVQREQMEMREVPEIERDEVRVILKEWGYTGTDLEDLLDRICSNPRAWMEMMMAFELKLAPVTETQARDSFVVVFLATSVGSVIPILPYLIPHISLIIRAAGSVGLAAVTLAFVGLYEARTTGGRPFQNALQMILIGLAAGFAGFAVGFLLHAS